MLTGVRVVECAERIAGPFCGRLLARLGAEVVKVERPGMGDPARAAGPFRGDEPDLEGGGLFAYLNAGKRSVEADPATGDGWQAITHLLDNADLLIQDEKPSGPGLRRPGGRRHTYRRPAHRDLRRAGAVRRLPRRAAEYGSRFR